MSVRSTLMPKTRGDLDPLFQDERRVRHDACDAQHGEVGGSIRLSRILSLRGAIAEGTYNIAPELVADAMLEWASGSRARNQGYLA